MDENEITHHGVKGMHWGVRRKLGKIDVHFNKKIKSLKAAKNKVLTDSDKPTKFKTAISTSKTILGMSMSVARRNVKDFAKGFKDGLDQQRNVATNYRPNSNLKTKSANTGRDAQRASAAAQQVQQQLQIYQMLYM